MPDPDFSSFPLVSKGHGYEDFEEGQIFEHHWGRTLNEGRASLFATVALRFEHWGVKQDDSIVFEGEREVLIKRRSHWGKESKADE